MIILKPKYIRALYLGYKNIYPFDKYQLPNNLKFKIIDDASAYGYFDVDPMRIEISRTLCTDFLLVKETLLHEMCHLVMYYNLGYKNYDEHSKDFYRLVYKCAKVYGLDNKKI